MRVVSNVSDRIKVNFHLQEFIYIYLRNSGILCNANFSMRNLQKMVLYVAIVVVCLIEFGKSTSDHGVGSRRRKVFLNNSTMSCLVAARTCRKNSDCSKAMKNLSKICKVTNGQCNTEYKDLIKCADIMDELHKEVFPKESCSCTKQMMLKCSAVYNKVYANPCFDKGKSIRDVLMTTPAANIDEYSESFDVIAVTSSTAKFSQTSVGVTKNDVTIPTTESGSASIHHLRTKGLFPTPTKEAQIEFTHAKRISSAPIIITENTKIDEKETSDTREDNDLYNTSDEEVIRILNNQLPPVKEELEEVFLFDGVDIDSSNHIDTDVVIVEETIKTSNSDQKSLPEVDITINEMTKPHYRTISPKTKHHIKSTTFISDDREGKSLLYSSRTSQNPSNNVSSPNNEYVATGIDIKIIAIICGTLLCMFVTAALVFVAYIRTHGRHVYVSGKKTKAKEAAVA